jgi:hypothetical protein
VRPPEIQGWFDRHIHTQQSSHLKTHTHTHTHTTHTHTHTHTHTKRNCEHILRDLISQKFTVHSAPVQHMPRWISRVITRKRPLETCTDTSPYWKMLSSLNIATPATMRDAPERRAVSTHMHSHTNNRRRERESARGRDRAKEGSNRLPCTLFGRRTCPGTRGEGQWEQACESIEMQRARGSVHATLTVTGCCQLSRCLPPACKRPAPSSTTGRPIASYVVRADRHRLQHVSTAGSCIVSPSAARLWLLRGRTAAAAASLVWDIRFGVAVPKGESSTLGDCGYRAPRPVVGS